MGRQQAKRWRMRTAGNLRLALWRGARVRAVKFLIRAGPVPALSGTYLSQLLGVKAGCCQLHGQLEAYLKRVLAVGADRVRF